MTKLANIESQNNGRMSQSIDNQLLHCDKIGNSLNMVMNYNNMNAELLEELMEALKHVLDGLNGEEKKELQEVMAMLNQNQEKISKHGGKLWNSGKHLLGLFL